MADVLKKVPVREQDPKVRATNFEEVCYGYNQEEAMEEASRCINCKNAKCIQGCPVGINIPAFVHEVKEGNIEEAYKIIGQSSALPAVCDVYVLRNHSAKENVSVVSKENLFLSVSWKDSLLITLWSMTSNRLELTRRTDTKLPLSVQALQDLPVQATLQSLAMM